jgi:phosphoribosylaminoimidazolecarboxamide formyltransferase / IMP cyclohydrolase
MEKRYALLSVANKRGIENLARGLVDMGFGILSTGGTAKIISDCGLPVTLVSEYIGSPDMMNGRIKTLHSKIHAGILAEPSEGHFDQLEAIHANPIDLVVVNLKAFENEILKPNVNLWELLDYIDLGGCALLRSAARNFHRATAICEPKDYEKILWQIAKHNEVKKEFRLELAQKAFAYTGNYDSAIAKGLALFDPETGEKK